MADHAAHGHTDPRCTGRPRTRSPPPPEKLAYVAGFDRSARRPDALITVDTDPRPPTYGRVLHLAELPEPGDELHHFSWNACDSALAHDSLYDAWDDQFHPGGIAPWMIKLDADPAAGGLAVDPRFFPHGEEFQGLRVHQTHLHGGDASSDSYCFR
ncbi:selenium-binding family protein [Kitasatospora sp. NBC_00374]|uniref:selenium-binding protein SBP56-related protein n=1 Tax=Kitasatospora sp. NBC_00374 TaxID=2975964 RepID=UPI0030E25FA1